MNAQLFKWTPDGWREGIPPTHGTYRLKLHPLDDFTFPALVTPISATEAVFQNNERDTPQLLNEGAQWQCGHDAMEEIRSVGIPQVTEAICASCGAHGRLLTRADLEVESA